MKRHITILSLLFFGSFTFQSCEKWFDVTANDQIKAEDQFSSVDGYRDALMGVYIVLTDNSLYAKDMSFNLVDILGQVYGGFSATGAKYFPMQSYNYTHIRSQEQIKAVWDKYYYAIANINSALGHMDESDISWYIGEQQIIRGELLALRAYLHFDLMRLFGHSGYANRPELATRMAIPYSRVYIKDYASQENYTETFKFLEADINEAIELLGYDPIKKGTLLTGSALQEINRDGFYDKRQNRMNYYAVKALQARVFAWQGGMKMELAARSAEEVINDCPAELLQEDQPVSSDKTISTEHIFGLKVERLNNISNPLLEAVLNTNINSLRIPVSLAETVYETSNEQIGGTDIRFTTLLSTEALGKVSIKLRQTNHNDLDYNTIPLMKLPEMYYISAEYYSTRDLPKAISMLQSVRESRRIADELSTGMDLLAFEAELLKEYRKEYVSEGQLFFFYKRKGLIQIPGSSVVADDKVYMLPFPVSEIEFGGRVQQW